MLPLERLYTLSYVFCVICHFTKKNCNSVFRAIYLLTDWAICLKSMEFTIVNRKVNMFLSITLVAYSVLTFWFHIHYSNQINPGRCTGVSR